MAATIAEVWRPCDARRRLRRRAAGENSSCAKEGGSRRKRRPRGSERPVRRGLTGRWIARGQHAGPRFSRTSQIGGIMHFFEFYRKYTDDESVEGPLGRSEETPLRSKPHQITFACAILSIPVRIFSRLFTKT
jgi:hypothetical protein